MSSEREETKRLLEREAAAFATPMLPLSAEEEQAIHDRLAKLPWPAPWTANTFEIDCPCPNGDDCGDSHTCEEVDASEAYPDGQCVVQIHTPGLETLAKPCAEFIAAARTDVPRLLATLGAERAACARATERLRAFMIDVLNDPIAAAETLAAAVREMPNAEEE